MCVDIDHPRVAVVTRPNDELARHDLPRVFGDQRERVAPQDAKLEEARLAGDLQRLHGLDTRGVPQRYAGVLVLLPVLAGP